MSFDERGKAEMKKNILKAVVCFSLLLNIVLGTYAAKREPVCDRPHFDTIEHGKRVVRYGQTAREIAEIYIESYQKENPSGSEESLSYDVLVSFDWEANEWVVDYNPILPYQLMMLDGDKWVRIREDSGIAYGYGWQKKGGLIMYAGGQ